MTNSGIDEGILREWRKCKKSPAYFIDTYCQILDSVSQEWIPFKLWKAQYEVLVGWGQHQYNIAFKARQLGLTWLALGYGLWGIVFHRNFELVLVSRRQDEAFYIAGEERLRGMYARLPDWMQADLVVRDNAAHWRLSNGSGARAFPSNNVDSYSANLLMIDEADNPGIDLKRLLNSAKPTIDAGGKLLLVSRSYKEKPTSYFKALYRAGKAGKNQYNVAFLAWDVHPRRDADWYEAQCVDAMANEGTLDSVYEQYPATDEQALAPRTLDKRIPPMFISRCWEEVPALMVRDKHTPRHHPLYRLGNAPTMPGLDVYVNPVYGREYVIGADPAEGNPTSDDSAAVVLDAVTGEECAVLAGKLEPSTFAGYLADLSAWYNDAAVLVERNNHGHAVLLALKGDVRLLKGEDGKVGWQTNTRSKAEMYVQVVEALRDEDVRLHHFLTMTQLQSIDGSKLSAPEGEHDDLAVAFGLAVLAQGIRPKRRKVRVGVKGLYG
jgi:hypothetical protein